MGAKAPHQLLSTNEVGGASPPLKGGDKGEGEKLILLTLPSWPSGQAIRHSLIGCADPPGERVCEATDKVGGSSLSVSPRRGYLVGCSGTPILNKIWLAD